MSQTIRQTAKRPEAFYETVNRRIKIGKAITVVNDVLKGKRIEPMRAGMAWNIINKFTPSMVAIQMQVEHTVATNLLDLQAKALEAGLDPTALLPESSEPAHSPADPPTPGCDSRD